MRVRSWVLVFAAVLLPLSAGAAPKRHRAARVTIANFRVPLHHKPGPELRASTHGPHTRMVQVHRHGVISGS